MNNPKTLPSGPVAERMYRDAGDLPKHKKVQYEKGKKVNVSEYKGQLLLIFLLDIVINWWICVKIH